MNGPKGNLAQIDRLRDLFNFAFRSIQSYVNNPENRLKVASIALFFVSIVIYTPTRSTSDLVGPLLSATRELVYLGENVFSEASFNSYSPFFYCVMAFVAQFTDWFSAMLWCVIQDLPVLGDQCVDHGHHRPFPAREEDILLLHSAAADLGPPCRQPLPGPDEHIPPLVHLLCALCLSAEEGLLHRGCCSPLRLPTKLRPSFLPFTTCFAVASEH